MTTEVRTKLVLSGGGFTDYTADANCQGAWLFADNLNDASGEGNTLSGTINGYSASVPTQYSTPQGKSADFERDSSHSLTNVDMSANFPGVAQAASFSVAFWFKRESTTDQSESFIGLSTFDSWAIAIGFNTSWGIFGRVDDGTQDVITTFETTIANTNWHHIVFSFDGANNRLPLEKQ
jgi:hypothetical protein